MLFKDRRFESEFDFGSTKKLVLSDSPYRQLEKAIFHTLEELEKVAEDNYSNNTKILFEHALEEYGIKYLDCKNIKSEDIDVYAHIERQEPERIQGMLRRMGVEKPDEQDRQKFILYLKLEYFFFFMRYIIFPNEKFYDVYKEKNKSSENSIGGTNENAKYSRFILDNLYDEVEDVDVAELINLKNVYDWLYYVYWSDCDFSKILSMITYKLFISAMSANDYPNKEEYIYVTKWYYKSIVEKCILNAKTKYKTIIPKHRNNPVNELVDYILNFDYSARISDMKIYFDNYFSKIGNRKRPEIPSNYYGKQIGSDEIDKFLLSDDFLNWIDNTKRKFRRSEKKKRILVIQKPIHDIYSYLEYSRSLLEKLGVSDLIIDSRLSGYIDVQFLASITWTLFNLDNSDIYYAKNTIIKSSKKSYDKADREIKNEINFFNRKGHWRGNTNMPDYMAVIIILTAMLDSAEETDKGILKEIINLGAQLIITLYESFDKLTMFERYIYALVLYKQVENEF